MQTRSQETRRHILHAARVLFTRDGYESTSVDSICEQAGISKGAFYHHFESKQSVFQNLMADWLATLDSGIALLRNTQADPAQALVQMSGILPEILRSAEGHLPIFLEFWRHAIRDKKTWANAIAPFRKYRSEIARMVEEGIRSGAFQGMDPDSAATAIVALATGLILQGVVEPHGQDWPEVSRRSLLLLMEGMTRRSE